MSIFTNMLKAAKDKAVEAHKERESAMLNKADESIDELELMGHVRKAHTAMRKKELLGAFNPSDKAMLVLADLADIQGADRESKATMLYQKWPVHYHKKCASTLEYLAKSGSIKVSTAPMLILPFLSRCVSDDKSYVSRQEFVKLIHSHYRAKGQALPATSPNWPNPFASYIGNIANPSLGCQLLIADDGGPNGSIVGYRIAERAKPYLARAK